MKQGDVYRTKQELKVEACRLPCCVQAHDVWKLTIPAGSIVVVATDPRWGQCLVESTEGVQAYALTEQLEPLPPLAQLGGMAE